MHDPHATTVDPSFRAAVDSTVRRIKADGPLRVSYLDNPLVTGNQQLVSKDRYSVALLFSSSLKETQIEDQIDHLRTVVTTPGFTTYVTGTAAQNHDYAVQSKQDLSKGDAVTVPILIIILLLVFGTLVASSLPLILAPCSITLSLAVVHVFGHYVGIGVS
jgi:RND superfamily putative drug exporter